MGPGQLHALRREQGLLRLGPALPRRHPDQRRAGRVESGRGAPHESSGHGDRHRREGGEDAAERDERHARFEAEPQLQPAVPEYEAQAFDNLKVRQAIAYAIDRNAIIQAVAFGEGEVTGPIAPALANYALPTSQYPLYTRDVAKAKQLLQEANVDLSRSRS